MHFVKYIARGDGAILNYDPALQISMLYKAPSTFTNWINFFLLFGGSIQQFLAEVELSHTEAGLQQVTRSVDENQAS